MQLHRSEDCPAPEDRLHFANLEPVIVGMPELCRVGLSENWLMKACGHRHWLSLAAAHDLPHPNFTNEAGDRLYPAFTMITVRDALLESVRENDRLEFFVDLCRIGRTRFASEIMVSVGGLCVVRLRMETTFVRRAVPGQNRSATRSAVAEPCRLPPPASVAVRPFRIEAWDICNGFKREEGTDLARLTIDPSPHEDFNGADFLYFSAFQAMIDRAEWHWLRRASPPLVTADRTIHYVGNIELGDRVTAHLRGIRECSGVVSHWVELRRESDDALIALSFTRRQNAPEHGEIALEVRGVVSAQQPTAPDRTL